MFKILIVEDVTELSDTLVHLINVFCSQDVLTITVANTFKEAEKMLSEEEFDVLFLDIELDNGKLGFDLLKDISPQKTHLVVTTSHANYALSAIKRSAIDFLLKPIDPEELIVAFQKIKEQEDSVAVRALKLKTLQENLNGQTHKKKIVLKTHESVDIVNVQDIVSCKADVNYTIFNLVSGEKIMTSKSLKEYELILSDSGFFRVHRSYLVNIEYIKSFQKKDGGYLLMKDDKMIPVSVRRRESLFAVLEKM